MPGSELYPLCMKRAHDCVEYYHSELNTNHLGCFFYFLEKSSEIFHQVSICFIARIWVGIKISEEWCQWPFFEFVAYTWFLSFGINSYYRIFSCFGRNILKDPIFDFSRLWPFIVGFYAAGLLGLVTVFNLQNYASNIFYLFSHIIIAESLLSVASIACSCRSSSP